MLHSVVELPSWKTRERHFQRSVSRVPQMKGVRKGHKLSIILPFATSHRSMNKEGFRVSGLQVRDSAEYTVVQDSPTPGACDSLRPAGRSTTTPPAVTAT